MNLAASLAAPSSPRSCAGLDVLPLKAKSIAWHWEGRMVGKVVVHR